jgi:hypothetical protein
MSEPATTPPKLPVPRLPALLNPEFTDKARIDVPALEPFIVEYRPPTGFEISKHYDSTFGTPAEKEVELYRFLTEFCRALYFDADGKQAMKPADCLKLIRNEGLQAVYKLLCNSSFQLESRLKN